MFNAVEENIMTASLMDAVRFRVHGSDCGYSSFVLGRDSYNTGRVARALSDSHQSPTSCPSGKLCRIINNQQCDIISETPCSCAELYTKDLNNPPPSV